LYGWTAAFLVLAVLCAVAAALYFWVDASRRLYVETEPEAPQSEI
jgi:hypothetical protein